MLWCVARQLLNVICVLTPLTRQRMGPTKLLHGLKLPAGVNGETFDGKDFDYFHEMIITQELVRAGARGYADGMQGGMVIGLPPGLPLFPPSEV